MKARAPSSGVARVFTIGPERDNQPKPLDTNMDSTKE
ncbi:hypothetical protein XBP1_960012 [Xenorhabdus bovienii str. puntauvense]|uniref:Uncharacterized protein n=1 Tax=Xenorhabdus bovienii str. puntauvense TaxID=1398201 RepID=A0A077NBD5_XENBV|nr:hypothetical protein XBP1_960012 [Xenorhabdus bovienii str. puntauvense]